MTVTDPNNAAYLPPGTFIKDISKSGTTWTLSHKATQTATGESLNLLDQMELSAVSPNPTITPSYAAHLCHGGHHRRPRQPRQRQRQPDQTLGGRR